MKIVGFAFGIRMVKSFSIEDKLGAIIDEILYSEKSEFNEKFFPEVKEGQGAKQLFDAKHQNKFTISPRDFIFEYNLKKNFDREFEKFLDSFEDIILKNVFKKFEIKNIARFGFIIKLELNEKDELLTEVSDVIKKHKGINDSLSLRFNVITKKPIKLGKIVTEDYDNEIITYTKEKSESPLYLTVDYQKYFKPELSAIKDATMDFGTFCKKSLQVFKQKYLNA